MVDLPTFNASVKEFRSLVKENIEQNKDKKKVDSQQTELMRKTLGIDRFRFAAQQKAAEEAKASREALNDLKRQLEEQGVDVKKAKNFQKLEAETVKKERAARLKAMPRATALKEQAKEGATYLRNLLGKYLGPGSKIGGLLGSIAGNLKTKVTGAISSLFGLLKTGALVAGLAALIVFLDSEYWKNLKKDLVPKLEAGLIRLKASIDAIIDAFIGEDGSFLKGMKEIFAQIFGVDSDTSKSISKVLDSFFGPQGSLYNGINSLMGEIFGTNIEQIKEKDWYKGLSRALGLIGTALVITGKGLNDLADLLTPPFFQDEEGNPYTARQLAQKVFNAFVGLTGALITLGLIFRPAKMFMIGGTLLFKAGKWTIFKPIQAAFTSLFGALGILGTQADELATSTLKGAAAGATKGFKGKPVKGATYEIDGKKFKFEGRQFVTESGKIADKATQAALRSGIKGGTIGFTDPMEANKLKISKMFPKIGALFSGPGKAILRALPFLGTLLTVGEGARILLSDAPKDDKIKSLGGLLFGTLGASGLAILGGLGGTFFGGPIGTILGGVVGGGLGFLAGDYVGQKLAEFLLDGSVDSPPKLSTGSGAMGDPVTAQMQTTVPTGNLASGANMNFGTVLPASSDIANAQSKYSGVGSMAEGQDIMLFQNSNMNSSVSNTTTTTSIEERDSILTAHLAQSGL